MEIKISDEATVMTTAEFAEKHKVEYAHATGFLKFMLAANSVKEVGKRPATGGKGKPSTLYSIPNTMTIDFSK